MTYNILESGSKGNCTIIDEIIMIDCGVSFKKLLPHYQKIEVILLTHIHGDHFNKKTIKRLAKEKPLLKFMCGEHLIAELLECGVDYRNITRVEIKNIYSFGSYEVRPIYLYHDVPNFGYKIFKNDKKLIYATDTYTLEGITAKNYDYYLIEGNYYEDEIEEKIKEKKEKGEFVYETRVLTTHLSKEEASKWLLENAGDNSEIVFMHEHKD